MNNTRQLAERITERVDNIPSGFRNVDKEALLADIRDLYDQAMELETVQYSASPEPKEKPTQPVAAQPKKVEEKV